MQNQLYTHAMRQGIEYLTAQQLEDGNFLSYTSTDPHDFRSAVPLHTNFIPALILTALQDIKNSEINQIKQKLATFLLSQKSEHYTFSYWSNDEPQKPSSYPDDLDDTFCALAGLYTHDPEFLTPKALAAVTKILLATETTVGGPYRTWFARADSKQEWLDVDIAVNANIAYFLSLIASPSPALISYIEHSIADNTLSSPYYPPLYPIAYYISRAYKGPFASKVVKQLQIALTASKPSMLEYALATNALMNFGVMDSVVEDGIEKIIMGQKSDGSWPAAAFCVDHYEKTQTFYTGCDTLTSALCLEAITKYQNLLKTSRRPKKSERIKKPSNEQHIKDKVLATAHQACQHIRPPLQNAMLGFFSQIAEGRHGREIMAFAALFNEALQPSRASQDTAIQLGAANLYGWTAYIIYDDFLDDEGDPMLLPIANIALRLSFENFLTATTSTEFAQFVRRTFDTIDTANAWELSHCRFNAHKKSITIKELPDFDDLSQLANRSLAHGLGPLGILVHNGMGPDSPNFQAVHTAIKHYIIAKQLNDDLHDWREDFGRGHITYVVRTILQELNIQSGSYKFAELMPTMQHHFWYTTLNTICAEMKHHIQLSKEALHNVTSLNQKNIIAQLIESIEKSVNDTLTAQAQTKEFLENF